MASHAAAGTLTRASTTAARKAAGRMRSAGKPDSFGCGCGDCGFQLPGKDVLDCVVEAEFRLPPGQFGNGGDVGNPLAEFFEAFGERFLVRDERDPRVRS